MRLFICPRHSQGWWQVRARLTQLCSDLHHACLSLGKAAPALRQVSQKLRHWRKSLHTCDICRKAWRKYVVICVNVATFATPVARLAQPCPWWGKADAHYYISATALLQKLRMTPADEQPLYLLFKCVNVAQKTGADTTPYSPPLHLAAECEWDEYWVQCVGWIFSLVLQAIKCIQQSVSHLIFFLTIFWLASFLITLSFCGLVSDLNPFFIFISNHLKNRWLEIFAFLFDT